MKQNTSEEAGRLLRGTLLDLSKLPRTPGYATLCAFAAQCEDFPADRCGTVDQWQVHLEEAADFVRSRFNGRRRVASGRPQLTLPGLDL